LEGEKTVVRKEKRENPERPGVYEGGQNNREKRSRRIRQKLNDGRRVKKTWSATAPAYKKKKKKKNLKKKQAAKGRTGGDGGALKTAQRGEEMH